MAASQYREYTSIITISNTHIVYKTFLPTGQLTDIVIRDGSENTNFAAVANAHKAVALSVKANTTSPPCAVDVVGKWVKTTAAGTPSGTVGTPFAHINVPSGNSGVLVLHCDTGSFTMKYSKNGGGSVTFVDGDTVTVANNDTLSFSAITLAAQGGANGYVNDQDTGVLVDNISLFNSTVTP